MSAGAGVRLTGVLLLLLAGCTARGEPVAGGNSPLEPAAAHQPYRYQPPPALDDGWATASLDSVGMDRNRLEQMTDAIQRSDWNIHAVLIEREGRLVYEEYFPGEDQRWGRSLGRVNFDRQTRHDLRSVSKSVISALVGIAVGSGAIRSVDEPLVGFFPDYPDLATPERRALSLRHALTMSAGLQWNEELPYTDPRNDEIGMTMSADPIRYVLSRPIVAAPGSTWNYNGGLTQLLAAIVQRSTGRPLREYARTVLFEPLGSAKSSGSATSTACLRRRPACACALAISPSSALSTCTRGDGSAARSSPPTG